MVHWLQCEYYLHCSIEQKHTDAYRLSVFFVAIADWLLFGLVPSLATYIGGALIIVAFVLFAREELSSGKH